MIKNTFSTIEQYIESFDSEQQTVLWEILRIIRHIVPKDTVETINYKMPTVRYNGNLIHFALFKNHLGVYPGPNAIVRFASELKIYKEKNSKINTKDNFLKKTHKACKLPYAFYSTFATSYFFKLAISITNRYFTSPFNKRS